MEDVKHDPEIMYNLIHMLLITLMMIVARKLDLFHDRRVDLGSVWLNDISRSSQRAPFGGMKQSGLGREKSRLGIEAYLDTKTMYISHEVPDLG